MAPLTALIRGLGAAGAAANARDELERSRLAAVRVEVAVRRVNRSLPHHAPDRAITHRAA